MNKSKVLPAIAGVGIIALIGGGATLATWTDTEVTHGATVTAGNLDISAIEGASSWVDVSPDLEAPKKIDITEFLMVPGDVLEYRNGFAVALHGDRLKADLEIKNPGATGEALQDSQGVGLEYEFYVADEEGAPVGDALASGKLDSGVPLEKISVPLTPEDASVVPEIFEDTKVNYIAIVRVSFDADTPDRNFAGVTTMLESMSVDLTQVTAVEETEDTDTPDTDTDSNVDTPDTDNGADADAGADK